MYDKKKPAIICFDGGNNNIKVVIFYMTTEGILKQMSFVIPHGYMRLSDTEWQKSLMKHGKRHRANDTFDFQLETKGEMQAYRVGAGVFASVHNAPLFGSTKYIPGGIDALFSAAMLKAFPNGHSYIYLGYGIPPTEWQSLETVQTLLTKQHKLVIPNPNGGNKKTKNISFVVRAAFGWDENAGGLVKLLSRMMDGQIRTGGGQFMEGLEAGDRLIVTDLGGYLGSMAYARIEENGDNLFAVIDHDNPVVSIDGGAITIREALRESLKLEFEDLRPLLDSQMDDTYLDKVLRTGEVIINGVSHSATDAVDAATDLYFGRIKNTYNNRFGGGRLNVKAVALTGGTTDNLASYMPNIFENNRIIYTDLLGSVYMANVNGGMIITLENLRDNNKFPFTKGLIEGF